MRSGGRPVLSLVVLASFAVAAIGCSHDTLSSGAQALNMTYTPSPSGSGRYDRATMDITKLEVLPVDPATLEIFGTEKLLFRFEGFIANLTLVSPVPFSNIALATGTYRVTRIEFTPPSLVDTDVIPQNPPICIDGVATLNGQSVGGIPPAFNFIDPESLTFTVSPGQTSLALTIDVPGLIAGYENSFTCQTGCGVGGSNCVTAFNQTTFRAALLANVTLE